VHAAVARCCTGEIRGKPVGLQPFEARVATLIWELPQPDLGAAPAPARLLSRSSFYAHDNTGISNQPSAPELGDWRELAYRHNARPVESLPREAYVWGAGIFGQALARRLADAGTVVRAFVDGKPELWGRKLRDGLVCIAPETLFARDPAPVAIGIHNYAVDLQDVIEPLSARAFDAWAPERLWRAAALAGHRWPAAFWLDHPFWGQCEATAALDGARQALELFADEASARVFWGELCARALGLAHLRARPEEGQYLPASLPRWPEPIRLIDAGAFTGDTVRAFLLRRAFFNAHQRDRVDRLTARAGGVREATAF
jgi:hypothetical protein